MKKRKYWVINKETGELEEFTPADSTVIEKRFVVLRNSQGILKVVFARREDAVEETIKYVNSEIVRLKLELKRIEGIKRNALKLKQDGV